MPVNLKIWGKNSNKKIEDSEFLKIEFFQPLSFQGFPVENFEQVGPAVWPAISNIKIYIFMSEELY